MKNLFFRVIFLRLSSRPWPWYVHGWNSKRYEASYVCASAGAGRCAPADSTPNTSARSPLPHLPQLAMRAALTLLIALQLVAVADSASVSDLPANIRSMRTKQLMQILEDRGVTCKHCSESKLPSQRTQQPHAAAVTRCTTLVRVCPHTHTCRRVLGPRALPPLCGSLRSPSSA